MIKAPAGPWICTGILYDTNGKAIPEVGNTQIRAMMLLKVVFVPG